MICDIKKTPRCKIYMAMFDYITEKFLISKDNKAILDRYIGGL